MSLTAAAPILAPLSAGQVAAYHRDGFVIAHGVFDRAEIATLADEASKKVVLELQPGDVAFFSGFTPHGSGPNRSNEWRRMLYLSYNAASDGGDQREKHYAEFKGWLRERYADYDKVNTFFR